MLMSVAAPEAGNCKSRAAGLWFQLSTPSLDLPWEGRLNGLVSGLFAAGSGRERRIPRGHGGLHRRLAGPDAFCSAALWGFLASVVSYFFFLVLTWSPLTIDLSAWSSGTAVVWVLALVGLAAAGFALSLGGRPLLAERWLGEA
jgi:hypothetical protein